MKDLKMHSGLFAVAVCAALLTWNRDTASEADRGLVLAWERDTTDVVSVRYRSPNMDVEIRRQSDADGTFLWAVESRGPQNPDTLQYPGGVPAHTLLARLATLRVIRGLGELTPADLARYGLDGSGERITVQFRDNRRDLVLGDSIFGSADRYAVEPATGAGYVLGNDIVNPLRIGEGALRERWLHHYQDADVATVRVAGTGGSERAMARGESGEWTPVGSTEPDAGFANFMDRVGQLAIAGYGAEPSSPGNLIPLLRVDYLDAGGSALGFVELLRDAAAERDPYYIRSERTRILARAVTTLAERVEQGLEEAF